MSDYRVFNTASFYTVAYRVTRFVEDACFFIGDLSLIEYALLCDIAELNNKPSVRTLQKSFSYAWGNMETVLALLEEKELVERCRSASDRRSFVLRETLKGRERLVAVDTAIAQAFVQSTPRATEERIERMVFQLHESATQDSAGRSLQTMLPALSHRFLYRVKQSLVYECMRMDLSVLEFIIMCVLCDGPVPWANPEQCAAYKPWLPIESPFFAFALSRLEDKHFIRQTDTFALTDAGRQRAELLIGRMHDSIVLVLDHIEEWRKAGIIHSVDNCLYLFGQ